LRTGSGTAGRRYSGGCRGLLPDRIDLPQHTTWGTLWVVSYRYQTPVSGRSITKNTGTTASNEGGVGEVGNQQTLQELGLEGPGAARPDPAKTGQVLDEVRDLLSYSWRDWHVSGDEALEALSLLAQLRLPSLVGAVRDLGNEQVERMLKNLPSDARSTPAFGKLITALGADRVAPYLSDLMSRGMFDWFVTDADAERVAEVILALPRPDQLKLLKSWDPDKVERMRDNLNDPDLLGEVMGTRFNLDIGPLETGDLYEGMDWDVVGLRQAWDVLEDLPESHVRGNPKVDSLLRIESYGEGQSASGYYKGSEHLVAIQYAEEGMDYLNMGNIDEKDPLYGGNYFDQTVRHEIGHAVDAKIGGFAGMCSRPVGGEWLYHFASNLEPLARRLVQWSVGPIWALDDTALDTVIEALGEAMAEGSAPDMLTRLEALPAWKRLSAEQRAAIENDPAIEVLSIGLDQPWQNASGGGVPVDGRIYQESYGGVWASYRVDARSRAVSQYQFRAPGEWFAEAYAAYYDPRGVYSGELLDRRDPAAKAWFDQHVDKARMG